MIAIERRQLLVALAVTTLMMSNTGVGWGQSQRPPIPPVTDEAGVVNWFLLYDEKIADFRRNFPSKIQ